MEEVMSKPNNMAPNFALSGDDGQVHKLSDYLGQQVILFFYPKDLTPGCTTEACDFSDNINNFHELSTTVIGISRDSLVTHARFKSKHGLKMLLLSDPDLIVHKLYGAYGEKTAYGKTSLGVIRSTFFIGKDGQLVKSWKKVRVKDHVKSVLDTVRKEEK